MEVTVGVGEGVDIEILVGVTTRLGGVALIRVCTFVLLAKTLPSVSGKSIIGNNANENISAVNPTLSERKKGGFFLKILRARGFTCLVRLGIATYSQYGKL